jgi:hypothetical protein
MQWGRRVQAHAPARPSCCYSTRAWAWLPCPSTGQHAPRQAKGSTRATQTAPQQGRPRLFELVAELLAVEGRLHEVVQPLEAVGEAQALQAQQLEAPAGLAGREAAQQRDGRATK